MRFNDRAVRLVYGTADEILKGITKVDPAARMCYYAALNLCTIQTRESAGIQRRDNIRRNIIKRLRSGKVKHTDRSLVLRHRSLKGNGVIYASRISPCLVALMTAEANHVYRCSRFANRSKQAFRFFLTATSNSTLIAVKSQLKMFTSIYITQLFIIELVCHL